MASRPPLAASGSHNSTINQNQLKYNVVEWRIDSLYLEK